MSDRRDMIVIGASSGGVRALRALLSRLPSDLPAAVFIIQHQSPMAGRLVNALAAAATLPVIGVDAPQKVRSGCVYVAPPDVHMVLSDGTVLATGGARENRARPSINVLFRTAAAEYGSRVIGVLLTGLLDDGVAGLEVIQRCGGRVIVQDPEDAEFPQLPQQALKSLKADAVLPLDQIAERLSQWAGEEASGVEIPADIAIEASLWDPRRSSPNDLDAIGEKVAFACPECGGPLWQVAEGGTIHFRCHTGHALSARMLLDSQADEIEQSLWVAVRSLTERADMLEKLAEHASVKKTAAGFRQRADETRTHAEQARQFLLSLRMTRPEEPLEDAPPPESTDES